MGNLVHRISREWSSNNEDTAVATADVAAAAAAEEEEAERRRHSRGSLTDRIVGVVAERRARKHG